MWLGVLCNICGINDHIFLSYATQKWDLYCMLVLFVALRLRLDLIVSEVVELQLCLFVLKFTLLLHSLSPV